MSQLRILVGCPGSGKTFRAKSMIKGVHPAACYIFDVNNEYGDQYKNWFGEMDGDVDQFVDKLRTVKNGVIVIEDATGFLPVNGRNISFVRIIQGRRHTHNTFVLLFHSMQDVPKYILRFCNYLVVFRTYDSPEYVKKTFADVRNATTDLYTVWKQVDDESRSHKFFSVYPPPKGMIPPSAVFSRTAA